MTLADIDRQLQHLDRLYDKTMTPLTRKVLCEIQAELMAKRAVQRKSLDDARSAPKSRHDSRA
jgi:hypothetical protein